MKTKANSKANGIALKELISRSEAKEVNQALDKMFYGFVGSNYCSHLVIEDRERVYITHARLKEFFESIEYSKKIDQETEREFNTLLSVISNTELINNLEEMFSGFIGGDVCSHLSNFEREFVYVIHRDLKGFFSQVGKLKS